MIGVSMSIYRYRECTLGVHQQFQLVYRYISTVKQRLSIICCVCYYNFFLLVSVSLLSFSFSIDSIASEVAYLWKRHYKSTETRFIHIDMISGLLIFWISFASFPIYSRFFFVWKWRTAKLFIPSKTLKHTTTRHIKKF